MALWLVPLELCSSTFMPDSSPDQTPFLNNKHSVSSTVLLIYLPLPSPPPQLSAVWKQIFIGIILASCVRGTARVPTGIFGSIPFWDGPFHTPQSWAWPGESLGEQNVSTSHMNHLRAFFLFPGEGGSLRLRRWCRKQVKGPRTPSAYSVTPHQACSNNNIVATMACSDNDNNKQCVNLCCFKPL